ncbi:MAG: UDP-4-amino-4,6-dideoxy-N-acetyl-beta-L-altrosamine N-acetyltransferase [Desulfuromonadaceae bacterium]|nr:UDP-4-amino-4,6-dideoxy-N-acetyl-beta-L-altrosamine N-acetyltransferase [Desulfuromonadaceae bacterium]MDD2855499.1 UDP-4-amino-4,6-dideoxy-N-acetyl-beta-L-altrosamine N-acetyltransferase [Desulfuromonadaceae bacterium]
MLKRDDCNLRHIEREDLEKILRWRNSERIRKNMYTDHVISADEHMAWFERSKVQNSNLHLIFEVKEKPAGLLYFTDIDMNNSKSYWGFYIGETDLPHGSGKALGVLGLAYAFKQLNIRKLCGEAFAFNDASIRFHKKLGFAEEGRLIKHILRRGTYEDVVLFATFHEDWIKIQQKLYEAAFVSEKTQI